jgi:uncharacterized protein (DUF362 family)
MNTGTRQVEHLAVLERTEVAISGGPGTVYPQVPPYHPSPGYPEYPFSDCAPPGANPAYDAVRRLFRLLHLDQARFGRRDWNPLGEIIRPGDKVVLKPNAVLDRHPESLDLYSIITHPAIIRAVVDYAAIALQGRGQIVIADAPQFDCDFDHYREVTALDAIPEYYEQKGGISVQVLDLRRLRGKCGDRSRISSARDLIRQEGDPRGYRIVDLAERSAYVGLPGCDRIYGADYDRREASSHHLGGKHEYCIAGTILEADVVISLPKLKTHGKVGVTLNLKGLVGINGDKNYVPHFRVGDLAAGGDEYPPGLDPALRRSRAFQRWMIDRLLARRRAALEPAYLGLTRGKQSVGRLLRRLGLLPDGRAAGPRIDSGDWQGNDTAWRMTKDLATILLYADRQGTMREEVQRSVFCLVDGITGGEGDGPLHPRPKVSGVLIGGFNPVRVDLVCTRLMGLDAQDYPLLRTWLGNTESALGLAATEQITVAVESGPEAILLDHLAPISPGFARPSGWLRSPVNPPASRDRQNA